MNIYVGNLARETNQEDLQQAFEAFGEVTSVNIIMDKFGGGSKGFGFVEMSSKTEAQAAIEALNGKDINGKALTVNEARPKTNNRGGKGNKNRGQGSGHRY